MINFSILFHAPFSWPSSRCFFGLNLSIALWLHFRLLNLSWCFGNNWSCCSSFSCSNNLLLGDLFCSSNLFCFSLLQILLDQLLSNFLCFDLVFLCQWNSSFLVFWRLVLVLCSGWSMWISSTNWVHIICNHFQLILLLSNQRDIVFLLWFLFFLLSLDFFLLIILDFVVSQLLFLLGVLNGLVFGVPLVDSRFLVRVKLILWLLLDSTFYNLFSSILVFLFWFWSIYCSLVCTFSWFHDHLLVL